MLLVLLVGAGLMIRSLNHLAAIHLGYDPNHIAHLRVDIPQVEGAKLTVAAGEILRDIAALPAVQSACVSSDVPLGNSSAIYYAAEGQPPPLTASGHLTAYRCARTLPPPPKFHPPWS